MNIIALLELASIDKSRIGSLTKEDYDQITTNLIALKESNSEIDDFHIDLLLKALKSYAEPFKAVLNNRILFNYFAGKDYARKNFTDEFASVEIEKIKSFVQLFLGETLTVKFVHSLETNKFEGTADLAEAHTYFPDSLNYTIKQHLLDKLDDAISSLKPPYGNFSRILYIRDRHFFTFLGNIKDREIEEKVMALFEVVSRLHNRDSNSELANKTFVAMNSYIALDPDFARKIKKYKDIADTKYDAYIPKRRNLTWVYVVVGAFVFIRIMVFLFAMKMNQSTYDDPTYDDQTYDSYSDEPRQLDRYYTNMKYSIDSFQVFLTSYKDSEVKQIKQSIKLKTGQNPFETFYQNEPEGDSNNYIEVTNNTGYDMVLLESKVLYDSIKMPNSAHFIKAGDKLEVNFSSGYTNTIFNMYLGKKWASFQTAKNKNLFIRKQSVVEYRFSQLVPGAKTILHTDYSFVNDAVVTYKDGSLKIDSPGAKINPLAGLNE